MSALLTDQVPDAVRVLSSGGLVALPTETVYGLGADADNRDAVARIYSVKGRPVDHPVIVHCVSLAASRSWTREFPDWAEQLAAHCWPGPLTLVLARSARAGDHVTGGQDTIGVRVPSHQIMREVLALFGGAIAAPSANRFGRVSPTTAAHVLAELAEQLDPTRDLILDGGGCPIGIESTIVDATGQQPRILRPGGITQELIEQVTGLSVLAASGTLRAPGGLDTHYAPQAKVLLAEQSAAAEVLTRVTVAEQRAETGIQVGLIALAGVDVGATAGATRLITPRNAAEYAQDLYAALREADERGMNVVVAVLPADHGVGTAVRDRLLRAATARLRPESS